MNVPSGSLGGARPKTSCIDLAVSCREVTVVDLAVSCREVAVVDLAVSCREVTVVDLAVSCREVTVVDLVVNCREVAVVEYPGKPMVPITSFKECLCVTMRVYFSVILYLLSGYHQGIGSVVQTTGAPTSLSD